jgi:wobble nucleotide-excising tRNase
MIETLEIEDVATYVARQTMGGLGHLNFVFGTNGAGKTTIGRVVADPAKHPKCTVSWRDGAEMQPLVYNRDFVDANFSLEANLKGIFTLGEEDIANEQAIVAKKAAVDGFGRSIAQLAKTLGDAEQKESKRGELAQLETQFKDRCWEQKRKHDAIFQKAFAGVRGDAAAFKERLLSHADSSAELKTMDYLAERASTVFAEAPIKHPMAPLLMDGKIMSREAEPILAKKVLGKSDVDIAAMIHRLGHSDWVKAGQEHLSKSAPDCPFCQQRVPGSFKASLESYFDETFESDIKAIADIEDAYAREAASLTASLQAVVDAGLHFLDQAAFASEKSTIEAKLQANALILANKRKEPSGVQRLESLVEPLSVAEALIQAANAKAADHNRIVDGLGAERTSLVAQVWRRIVEDIKPELDQYRASKKGLAAAIASLEKQIATAEATRKGEERELVALEKKSTSVQPTIDAINGLLKSFGFKTFALAKDGDEARYKLVRHDGRDAKHSLSEGEKSFVTFLYFYHLIKGSDAESGATRDRIVVFDDPVSSMDSDVLFIVSSLIRSLFDDMRNNRGYVKQVFVLTHNVYFHKEVCFVKSQRSKGGKDAGRKLESTYWVVRKTAGGPCLESFKHNPIKTSYDLLWDEIRKEDKNPLTIQNTMRRILEHYFRILGGIDFDELCEKFHGKDKVVCRSLLSWVNDGSHYSHDDAHYAFGDDGIEAQLGIFKKIFEQAEQMPHYEMMMDRK